MVFEKVAAIVAKQMEMEPDEIQMETSLLDDLGADSLDLVNILTSLEGEFGMEIPIELMVGSEDEDIPDEEIHTVEDIVRFLEEHS